uniref:General transcription factor IIH subunit 4 n=1 Tax=Aquila chrysaetos chrysaetos TaxID=223781 RepID=A0A663ET47_AQUCH
METAPPRLHRGQLQCKNLHEFLRGLSPPHPRPPLWTPRHLPGRFPGAAGVGAGGGDADAVPGAAPAPGCRHPLGEEGAQQGQSLVGRHEPTGAGQARPRRAGAGQVRRGALGGDFALYGGVSQRSRESGFGPASYSSRAYEEARGMDLVEILSFLFQLSFSTLGKDYSVEGMSESLLTFLQHLREFGLVFQRKRKSRRFYPTRLAIALASGTSGAPPRTRRSRLRPRRDQLPHLRLHRLGAADRPHRPFLRAPLPFPQPGGGPGDEGQRAGGHRQRHHRRPDHPFPPHPGAPRHGQADPGAASHHHRPDPPVGAGAGPAALLRGGAVQPVPVAGGFRGAAGPRAGAGGTGFRKPRETVDGGDPRRAPRRQTLLEKAETQRLKLAIDPGGGPLSPVSLPPPPGKHVRAVGSWGPPIPG